MNGLKPVEVQPVHLFVTGGAGKSHLINTIYHTTTRSFRHVTNKPEQPTVLLMAQTGVAPFNSYCFSIPKESGDNDLPMSDQKRTQIRMSDYQNPG